MTTTHQAMRQLFQVQSGINQLHLPGIFPDHQPPIVRQRADGERELVMAAATAIGRAVEDRGEGRAGGPAARWGAGGGRADLALNERHCAWRWVSAIELLAANRLVNSIVDRRFRPRPVDAGGKDGCTSASRLGSILRPLA